MTIARTDERAPRKPLRLWPGVLAAGLLVLFKLAVPIIGPGAPPFGLLGGLIGGLVILAWWVFFSRAPWSERLGALALMAAALFVASRFLHDSIAKAGGGWFFPVLAIPVVSLVLVAWAVAARRLGGRPRRASMVATILIACGAWTLVRTEGITGEGDSDFEWRWTRTREQRLIARAADEPARPPATLPALAPSPLASAPPAEATPAARAASTPHREAEWPGFRGPRRDGIIRGVRIATDWSSAPPVELWRRPIGPGWSSFAVDGDFLYTQEQRGDDEVVACYRVSTGEPVWRHRDAARFWESNAGAGPRGTPTLHGGRVYTFGATGILNALDARTGAVIWTRNAAADTSTKNPGWGFASSPLVVDHLLVVATAGTLVAYDRATGHPRWSGPKRSADYSSPHLATINGVRQVLLLNGKGATSVAPADGKVLWEHALTAGSRIVQPALTEEGDILVTNGAYGAGNGIRRLAVVRGSEGWTTHERWTSTGLKPNFNDLVVHEGHAFGFDGSIMACLDVADGTRKWKGGRYGNGQVVLLADQDLLLVLSEEGELALVRAAPDQFTELVRFKAIEGKTWNHPVLVGDVLLVRNGEEMAAFRLPLATADGGSPPQPSRLVVN